MSPIWQPPEDAPGLLTAREQQLLASVRGLLEIPYPATWQGRDAYEMALRERVYRLLGILDGVEHTSVPVILQGLERTAARPLGYEPAPEDHSP